jgi:hypothetical protein
MTYTNNKNRISEILKVYILNCITKSYILNIKIRSLVTEYAFMIKLVDATVLRSLVVLFGIQYLRLVILYFFFKSYKLAISFLAAFNPALESTSQTFASSEYCSGQFLSNLNMDLFPQFCSGKT